MIAFAFLWFMAGVVSGAVATGVLLSGWLVTDALNRRDHYTRGDLLAKDLER